MDYPTLAALRAATGFELSGRAGDPMFNGAASGDFTLWRDSPAIYAGLRLPGINDAFGGAAPDLGAFESGGGGADATRPAPIRDFSVGP